MRDFTTIDVTVFATKMIPLLRAEFNWNSPISLIGIRAALEPSPAENRMDVYDDIILRVIDGSITQWVTSTDPSKALVMIAFAMLLIQCLSELTKRIAVMRGLIPDPHASQVKPLEAEVEQIVEALEKR